jgi:hypothetical protein
MTMRKPTLLRWSEEAEANHIREWAELDHGAPDRAARAGFGSRRRLQTFGWTGVSGWLRVMVRRRSSQLMQDG